VALDSRLSSYLVLWHSFFTISTNNALKWSHLDLGLVVTGEEATEIGDLVVRHPLVVGLTTGIIVDLLLLHIPLGDLDFGQD